MIMSDICRYVFHSRDIVRVLCIYCATMKIYTHKWAFYGDNQFAVWRFWLLYDIYFNIIH